MSVDYYIKDGHFLVSHGTCSVEQIPEVELPLEVVIGAVNLPDQPSKYSGFKWNFVFKKWVDCRTAEQKLADDEFDVQSARYLAYPPLSSFADAMYWQSKGDDTKMQDYLAACEAVKLKYPKPKN